MSQRVNADLFTKGLYYSPPNNSRPSECRNYKRRYQNYGIFVRTVSSVSTSLNGNNNSNMGFSI